MKFKKILPYVTQINSENIKTSNLLRRMHYSGPDSPAFSQLNKKALWRHFPQIQTAHTRHRSNLQHAYFIYSIVIK